MTARAVELLLFGGHLVMRRMTAPMEPRCDSLPKMGSVHSGRYERRTASLASRPNFGRSGE